MDPGPSYLGMWDGWGVGKAGNGDYVMHCTAVGRRRLLLVSLLAIVIIVMIE